MPQQKVTRKKAPIKSRKPHKSNTKNTSSLRIIGGDWRSRKLPILDAPSLRPTPDRIRETLFNWLQGKVYAASCLDMFAGSGALGFEALSRGAKEVIFVEKNPACATQLKENLETLKAQALVLQTDALNFLQHSEKPAASFDLVFLDPPFRQGLVPKSLNYLANEALINEDSLIYIEHEAEESFIWSEFNLEVLKQTKAGQVHCFLLKKTKA